MKFDVEQWEVDNFKQALYLDGEEEDQLIKDYLKNAKAYVQNAVNPTADLTSMNNIHSPFRCWRNFGIKIEVLT